MTKQLFDGEQVNAGHRQLAGKVMTAIMKPVVMEFCVFEETSPRLVDIGELGAAAPWKN